MCRRQPAVGAPVGVGVPADAHGVVGLVDEAQRLHAGALVAVEVEHRRAGEEEALRGGRHERREVGQRVGVAEGAVGAVGGEHLDHRLDVVLRHPDRVAGEQLLDLDDVGDLLLVHRTVSPRRTRSGRRIVGVVGTAWQVRIQPSATSSSSSASLTRILTDALDQPGHAGGAVAGLARRRRPQPHLPGGLQDRGARVVRRSVRRVWPSSSIVTSAMHRTII